MRQIWDKLAGYFWNIWGKLWRELIDFKNARIVDNIWVQYGKKFVAIIVPL